MSAGWRTDPALSRNSKPPPFRRWRIHRRKEAFHGGVAPYVSGPAHRTIDAIVGHEPLELLACVLAAAVGVIRRAPGARQIAISNASGRAARSSRLSSTSDNAARKQIDHRG